MDDVCLTSLHAQKGPDRSMPEFFNAELTNEQAWTNLRLANWSAAWDFGWLGQAVARPWPMSGRSMCDRAICFNCMDQESPRKTWCNWNEVET